MSSSFTATTGRSESRTVKPFAVIPKTIIITGHQGFLGSAIAKRLTASSSRTIGVGVPENNRIVSSLCSREYALELPDNRLDDIIRDTQPTALVHCAGTADVGASFRDPPGDYRRNVELTAFVLESLRRYAPRCQFILLSSAAVYGNPRKLPVNEAERCIPISPYGCHKLLGEQIVEEFVAEYGLNAAVLRIFSAYGSGLKKQVIYDLCRKLHENANTNISLFGTGEESRDFIHADDIAAGIDHAITHELNGTYNLASGIETKISNLANRLRILCKSQAELIFTGESRAGDPLRWQADISKLTATGFRPETTLDVGLKQYHDWYCQLEHN